MANVYQQAASYIAKREGKKSSARIGDVREILKILVDQQVEAIKQGLTHEGHLAKLAKRALERGG